MSVPVLKDILRQHAEEAAHLWCVYDWHLLHPDENPDMDEERLARLVDRLNAHLDGLRVAGKHGQRIAQDRYEEFPEAGELFVLRVCFGICRRWPFCPLSRIDVTQHRRTPWNSRNKSTVS